MDAFQFIKHKVNTPINIPDQLPFFFHLDFTHRHGDNDINTYLLKRDAHLCAIIHFKILDKQAISFPRATYGGMAVLHNIDSEVYKQFLQFVFDELTQSGIDIIEIRNSPTYFNYAVKISDILINLGFKIKSKDINQYTIIDDNSFPNKINRNRKRNLKQCHDENFKFSELSIDSLYDVYTVLTENRNSKDYSLSMSYEELLESMKRFPKRYLLFAVKEDDKIIACSICLKVNNKIIYDFYHGESPEYTKYSPVTLLVEGIHNYALSWSFRLLDFGTSSPNGILNKGVFEFKKSLGASSCEQTTFTISK